MEMPWLYLGGLLGDVKDKPEKYRIAGKLLRTGKLNQQERKKAAEWILSGSSHEFQPRQRKRPSSKNRDTNLIYGALLYIEAGYSKDDAIDIIWKHDTANSPKKNQNPSTPLAAIKRGYKHLLNDLETARLLLSTVSSDKDKSTIQGIITTYTDTISRIHNCGLMRDKTELK